MILTIHGKKEILGRLESLKEYDGEEKESITVHTVIFRIIMIFL